MRVLQTLPARAFAVLVDKRLEPVADPYDVAWEGMLQRLARTSTKEEVPFMVIHDDGENDRVRAWVRRARRHLTAGRAFGPGGTRNPARLLVDDPVSRNSRQSYFVQLADLVPYAAFRDLIAPGTSVARVCPQQMWLEIGAAIHAAVNAVRPRAAPGIVVR